MATTTKALFRGAASTTNTTLYTTPTATTTVVTSIIISSGSTAVEIFTLNLNDVAIASNVNIASNSLASFDIKQVLPAGQTITGSASTTAINFHISGVEIS